MSCGYSSISPSPSHSKTFHESALVQVPTFPGVSFEALQIWLPPTLLPSLLAASSMTLSMIEETWSIWLEKFFLASLVVFVWASLPVWSLLTRPFSTWTFFCYDLFKSVLCLVLLAFNSMQTFWGWSFPPIGVQIKMPAANDTTPPFKRNAQDSNKAGSTWPLITCLTLGKFFTSYEGSVSIWSMIMIASGCILAGIRQEIQSM